MEKIGKFLNEMKSGAQWDGRWNEDGGK